jgi:hypothetical protein
VDCLKNGLFLLFFAMLFIFGQLPQNDFSSFETAMYQSQGDIGSIDAFIDPGIPQQAVLNSYKNVRHTGRLNLTKNVGFKQAGLISTEHNTAAVSTIKESVPINIKNDILLKLRI